MTKKWLEPEKHNSTAIVETLVTDRYLRALPYEAKKIISQKITTSSLVEAVEQYQASSDRLRPTRKEPLAAVPIKQSGPCPKGPKPSSPLSSPPSRVCFQPAPKQYRNTEAHPCFHCGELGLISWQCGKPDEPMPTAESVSGPHTLFAALLGEWIDCQLTFPVTVNQRDMEVLLDSGSARTLVHESVLEAASPAQGGLIPIVCVHGDTHEYPTTVVKLITTKGSFNVEVGVIKTLPVPILIGRDCPALRHNRGSSGNPENVSPHTVC